MYLAIGLPKRLLRTRSAVVLLSAVLSVILFPVFENPADAVPASPKLFTLRQPNGMLLRARLRGDEWHHWWQTLDGRIVERDAAGWWATRGVGQPPASPRQLAMKRSAALRGRQRVVPSLGTGHIPVLCINYSDTTTQFNPSDVQTSLFSGSRSMAAFYTEVSYGKFTVDAGPNGVGGWYDASNTHDHYGANVGGNDAFPAELVIEAVKAADAAGFDFAPYDQDGDGYVDSVAIVHEGTDEAESGIVTDIWSHSWDLNSAQFFGDGTGEVTTSSGVKVNHYVIQPERTVAGNLTTIGVFCHEYGHALGMPDFYDYTYTSQGLGAWTLMAGGSWNGNGGDSPAHFDAWCKVQLGWIAPTVVTTSTFGAQAPQVEQNPVVFKVVSTSAATEYYLVENRQNVGFDAPLPANGLLIYHVDDTQTDNNSKWYPGYTSFGHYWVALEQADGLWQLEHAPWDSPPGNEGDVGDPYPGTTGSRTYDDLSTPSATTYADVGFPLVVRNVSASGAAMTLDIVDTRAPLAPTTISAIDTPGDEGESITVTWSKSGDDGAGANDVVDYDLCRAGAATGPFTTVASLPKGTTLYYDTPVTDGVPYWYKVVVKDSSGLTSETKVVGPATARHDGAPPTVDTLTARDTPADNGGSISLSWAGYQGSTDVAYFNVYRATQTFQTVTDTGVLKYSIISVPPDPTDDAARRTFVDDGSATNGLPKPLDLTDYWYAVTAVDEVGNEIPTVTAIGAVQSAPNLNITFAAGLRMITLPAVPVDPSPLSVFQLTDPSQLNLARWDPVTSAYHTVAMDPNDPVLSFTPGAGFWLRQTVPSPISVAGTSVTASSYEVPIGPGWNMVGSPYNQKQPFVGIVVNTTTGTVTPITASNDVRKYGWRYDASVSSYRLVSPILPGGQGDLPALESMWIYAYSPGLSLGFTNLVSAGSPRETAPPKLDGWQVRLTARTDTAADLDNFIGVTSQAASLGKIVSPPPMAGGVDLFLTAGPKGSDRLAADLRESLGARPTWDAVVECATANTTVRLSWPDLSAVPNNLRPMLTDLATGRSVYMRTASGYTYPCRKAGGQRRFRIRLETSGAGLMLSQLAATPLKAGGAEVVYTLSRAPAQVQVEVLNVAGRKVATVGPIDGQAGVNRTLWNGLSSGGQRVPAGRYIVHVTAVAGDTGETANALALVTVGY
jgi:M6 family metalloprotease-like protein